MNATATVNNLTNMNATDLQALLHDLQAKAESLETPDADMGKIHKEIAEIYGAIRTQKKSRGTELDALKLKQESFQFTIKELFGDDALSKFTDLEITHAAQERGLFTPNEDDENQDETTRRKNPGLSEERMTNLLTIGSYEINGETVEMKLGDYDRDGKAVKALIGPKRVHKKEIMKLGVKGFDAALSDIGRELILKNHVGTVGRSAGGLVFDNLGPVITYTKFDKNLLERELGIDKLRTAHEKANKATA